ncbi:hypothetical protein ACKWTF_016825 [Chironomus riparius]
MDLVSEDELRLLTDDELSDADENLISNNGQPVYGRDMPGSFGRKVTRGDLDRFCLIVLKSENNGHIRLLDLLEHLTSTYRLNFITNISYKVKRNPTNSIIYVYSSYVDEAFRFLNEIQTDSGSSFLLGNDLIHAKLFNNFIFGLAQVNPAYRNNSDVVTNLNFNFTPRNSISPSHNILHICERALSNDLLKRNIVGISLKLNKSRRCLFNYGSFILKDFNVATETIVMLREQGISASYATFSSFLMNNNQINHMRNNGDGSLLVSDYMLNNNALVSQSTVDFFIPQPINNHNNIADLIYPIVQEVLRSLNVNANRFPQHPRIVAPVHHVTPRRRFNHARSNGTRSYNLINSRTFRSHNSNNNQVLSSRRFNNGFRHFRRGPRNF